jgi:molybdopterin synthase sulfur carrier subunit
MNLKVLYFASIRETIGLAQESVQTNTKTVGELRVELAQRGDLYKEALSSDKVIRTALNQNMCFESEQLIEGDEVAFFPPVTGG